MNRWIVEKDLMKHHDQIKSFFTVNYIYNQLHDILRLFDVLPNFPFTPSEKMGDYYL